MKKLFFLVSLLFITTLAFSQVDFIKPTKGRITTYDSLTNFLHAKDLHKYVGQEFYILPRKSNVKDFGHSFDDFDLIETISQFYIQKKVFVVDKIISKYSDIGFYYIKMHNKRNRLSVMYYQYSIPENEGKFNKDILVMGYYNKLKRLFIGRSFYTNFSWLLKDHYKHSLAWIPTHGYLHDFYNNKGIKVDIKEKWKVIDATIEPKYNNVGLIFQNAKKDKVFIPIDNFTLDYLNGKYVKISE